jgi:hypothetical protein
MASPHPQKTTNQIQKAFFLKEFISSNGRKIENFPKKQSKVEKRTFPSTHCEGRKQLPTNKFICSHDDRRGRMLF